MQIKEHVNGKQMVNVVFTVVLHKKPINVYTASYSIAD